MNPDLLKQVRTHLNQNLWQFYKHTAPHADIIESALSARNANIVLDHCAIIDLPSIYSGMEVNAAIFSLLGYQHQGRDYLAEKHNDFLWMAEKDADAQPAKNVLPQVVLADFRLPELPTNIKTIIEKYTRHIQSSILDEVQELTAQVQSGDALAAKNLLTLLSDYFTQRNWPLPTLNDFKTVAEANELIAWVLAFGRRPNHFTIGAHLLGDFRSLPEFNNFIQENLGLPLNHLDGTIKGNSEMGIEQSSTLGPRTILNLADGSIEIPGCFMEFVWRHSKKTTTPKMWNDYFTGFIARNANRVIESLYEGKTA